MSPETAPGPVFRRRTSFCHPQRGSDEGPDFTLAPKIWHEAPIPRALRNEPWPRIAASTVRHCVVVLLRLHTGNSGTANAAVSCSVSPSAGSTQMAEVGVAAPGARARRPSLLSFFSVVGNKLNLKKMNLVH
jgi:hypothetical protein